MVLNRRGFFFKVVIFCFVLSLGLLTAACNPFDKKTKSGLQVITGDAKASLFLDGQYLDKTPFIGKDIKPGTYTLRIQPDDSKLVMYETPVTLRKGLLTVVTWMPGDRPETGGGVIYEMEELSNRKQTELVIASIPDGAIITIPDRDKEFAPVTLSDLSPGSIEFTVSLPSYDTQQNNVNLVEGYRTTATVKLAKSEVTVIDTIPSPVTATAAATTPSPSPVATTSGSARQASASAQQTTATTTSLSGARVQIKPTNYFQNGKEVLRVRDAAGNTGKEIGLADVGKEYPYLNLTEKGWHQISFNNQKGWVTTQFSTLIQ